MRNTSLFSLILASTAALGACNAITGADALVVQGEGDGGSGGGGTTTSNTGTAGSSGGTTSNTTTTLPPAMVDAPGVAITQIALYQGVKAVLMFNGQDTGNTIPIVANRDAVMRIFVATDFNYNGKPVLGRLTIDGNPAPIEVTAPVNGMPTDNKLGTTFNFTIPAAAIQPGFAFKVQLLQEFDPDHPPSPFAHYPTEGFAPTNAQSVGAGIKLVLVPVRYGADGSNRLPDTSPQMIQGYKDLFQAMYPTPNVDVTVRDPVSWNQTVGAGGNGWDDLLSYIGQVRSQDNAPFDAYYYGIFNPASSVNSYCGGGCVAGLGNIAGVGDSYSRAAIGLGFSEGGGAIAYETAVHEIGHTHGRYHSPCGGAAGTDPNYPHSGAKIGEWGFNILTNSLYNPTTYTDVMGYCTPIWVSDYTWKGLFQRIKSVNGASIEVPPEMMNRTYDRARIDMDGDLHWLPPVRIDFPPQNMPMDVAVETPEGAQTVTAHFYPYDHLPGGVVVWPQAGGPSSSVTFQWQGQVKSLVQ